MSTIIVGDLHLDKIRKVTYGDAAIWNNKPFELLDNILIKENPKILVLLGDIFDKYKPDSLSVVRFLSIIKDIPEVFILEGNHDRPKMEQDYSFQELDKLHNITVIHRNTILNFLPNYYGIGWCDTQEVFLTKLELLLNEIKQDSILCLHCNHSDWQNEMDNNIPKEILEALDEKNVTIFAGHDHSHFTNKNFISLGSIMPNTIREVGKKYYWTSNDGLVKIDHRVGDKPVGNDVILTRIEPVDIDKSKAYYIKTSTAIEEEDLKLEEKDLHIDIIADFCKEASIAGFDLDYVSEFLGEEND